MNPKPKNLSLIVGLAIPVFMVLFIAVAINGPRWFSTVEPPQHDFLYMTGQHSQSQAYVVEDGHVSIRETDVDADPALPADNVRFFIHDVARNASREIDFEAAQKLLLDTSLRSPDGFTISPGRRGGWFIFGYGRDYNRRYIVKEAYSQRLELMSDSSRYDYYWNYRFLGWLTDGQ